MPANVKILGLKDNHSPDQVIEQVAIHYKRDNDEFKTNLKAALATPALAKPLLQNLDNTEAEQARLILDGFGLVCEVQQEEELTLAFATVEKKHRCPACNHEQAPKEDGEDICEECGVVASKFSDSKRQQILEEEKQKVALKQQRSNVQVEQEQAEQEEENIRNDVRQQLGIEKKTANSRAIAIFGVVAVAAIGAFTVTQTEFGQSLISAEKAEEVAKADVEPARARVTMATMQAMATAAAQHQGKNLTDAQRVANIQALVASSANGAEQPGDADGLPVAEPGDTSVSNETYSEAFEKIKEIKSAEHKLTAIQAIAKSATDNLHSEASIEVFEKEFRGFSYGGTEKLGHQIVEAWLQRKNIDRAYKTALKFRDQFQKTEAIRHIVQWQVSNLESPTFNKAIEDLEQISSSFKSPIKKSQVLSAISFIYKIQGEADQSEKYLDLAFEQSDLVIKVDEKITVLSRIGEDRLAVDDTELGLHIFENIKGLANGLSKYNPAKARSFRTIATSLARSGNFLDAKDMLDQISNEEVRQQALIDVAEIATQADRLEIAAILLETNIDPVLVGSN